MSDSKDRKYRDLIQHNFLDGQTCDDMPRLFATSDHTPLKIAEYAVAAAHLRVHEGCQATETWMEDKVACSDGTIESIPSVIAARIACASYCVEAIHHGWDDPIMDSQEMWALTDDAVKIVTSARKASGEPRISKYEMACWQGDLLDEFVRHGISALEPVMDQITNLACKLVSTGTVTAAEIKGLASSALEP